MHNPEVIAHRGLPRRARENTLKSFEAALDAGADAIELDVHSTSDGVVVVHHDPWLAGTEPGAPQRGPLIALMTSEELVAHDSGRDVPALVEVLSLVGTRATVYVEIKAPHIEDQVVAAIRSCETPCAVHSFDHRASQRVRRSAPEIPVGILQTSYLVDPVAALTATGARDLWQHWEMIDEPLIRCVHDAGGRIIAWTVNETKAIEYLTSLGVDGLCSDVTDHVRAVLGARA
jgi:glycerophosphoryl diester phosphodiesterase